MAEGWKPTGNGLIYVGIPRERFLIPDFVDNRDQILGFLRDAGRGCGYYQAESHRVDRNRDAIVKEFLKHDATPEWLLMLDSDMVHPVSCGVRLANYGLPVVGGLYFHRGPTHDPVAFVRYSDMRDEWGRMTRTWEPIRDRVYDFLTGAGVPMRDGAFIVDMDDPCAGVEEVDAVGTGCMIIHRSVLEDMEPPWFEYRDGATSEDLEFCDRVIKELGLTVYCDLSCVSGHFRQVPMGQAQFRTIHEGRGVSGSSYEPEGIAGTLAGYLVTKPEHELKRIREYKPDQLAEAWNFHAESGFAPEDFYLSELAGQLYLYDLIRWNASPVFKRIQKMLIPYRGLKVLEIGAGIGTVAIQLAIQENEVDALEINPTLRGFARRRWEVQKIPGRAGTLDFIAAAHRIEAKSGTYDLVVAIDTFEHMTDEGLEDWIDLAGYVLKRGGYLFCHNTWGQQDIYPMHMDHSKLFLQLTEEAGIFMLDAMKGVKVK